jgi:hypothetical protein
MEIKGITYKEVEKEFKTLKPDLLDDYEDYFSNNSIFKRWSLVHPNITMKTSIKCDKICCNILQNKIDEKIGVSQLLMTLNKNE